MMNEPEASELQGRGEPLDAAGLGNTDVPPPAYRQTHGEVESDIEHLGHDYPAVVTAHFPDHASAEQAVGQLSEYNFSRAQAIQIFEKEPPEIKGDENDSGLAPGEVAILVKLDHEGQGAAVVQLCEQAGAKHARYYPPQHIGHV